MCRFLAYTGPVTLMQPWLFESSNSLVAQSRNARLRSEPTNGDGFGVGWYPEHNDPLPGTFVSIEPAWSNRNLKQLAAKVPSGHFFAHVRDATVGMPVSQANCHPFQWGPYLWMHNGYLDRFALTRRSLSDSLSDTAYSLVTGNTDTEHCFALFLDQLGFQTEVSQTDMAQALHNSLQRIMELRNESGVHTEAMMNFAVSNGDTSLFTRFCSAPDKTPPSLYFSTGSATIVASEPVSSDLTWTEVEPGQMLILNRAGDIDMVRLTLQRPDRSSS